MFSFELKGDPIPWKRPGRNNKTGAIYDQQKFEKEQLRWLLKSRYREEPLKVPVEVQFTFYMPIPKSTSGPRRRDMLYGVLKHMSKPDCDNMCKFYLDVMNETIYEDDSQVFKLSMQKLYATEPCTLIEISPYVCDFAKQMEAKKAHEDDTGEGGEGKFPGVCPRKSGNTIPFLPKDRIDGGGDRGGCLPDRDSTHDPE
ncbi:MAG: RusA family crossover junction endodeoxyribonuclease [Parachlamydia sp.]|nr:RusA family crossover junction endodeoxyribonuclease [Parachlamydia sp.]